MRHRITIAALAAAALIMVACEDGAGSHRLATEPGDRAASTGEAHYVTTGRAAVVSNHRLQPVAPARSAPGVSAAIVAGSGVASAITLDFGDPGIAVSAGQSTATFTDSSYHHHTITLQYGGVGGPPVAMRHYVDGSLVSINAYTWQRTTTGWVRTRSYLQSGRDGKLYGTYTTTTTATPVSGTGSGTGAATMARIEHSALSNGLQRLAGSAAYGLAFMFAPQDATAQSLALPFCMQQWLRYAAAAAVVVGIEAAIAEAPVLTPLLMMQLASSLALLSAAEDSLLDCVLDHQSYWPIVGSGSGGGSASGGGSGGGSGDCLEGSYAAACTTAFTL